MSQASSAFSCINPRCFVNASGAQKTPCDFAIFTAMKARKDLRELGFRCFLNHSPFHSHVVTCLVFSYKTCGRLPESDAPPARTSDGNQNLIQHRTYENMSNNWCQIQVFKNWVNDKLRSNGKETIDDLGKGLSDGTKLVALMEALQKRRCAEQIYEECPTEIQKLSNVQVALDYLYEDGVKLVNIGASDITKGNLKLILGLIWCLILRYQIVGRNRKIPPKKLLMEWLRKALPPYLPIQNFTSDWNNGIALGAENCRFAMETAELDLGVPMILTPEEMASPQLDEQSCMTYLSYFVQAGSTPEEDPVFLRSRRLRPKPSFKFALCDVAAIQTEVNTGGNTHDKDPASSPSRKTVKNI